MSPDTSTPQVDTVTLTRMVSLGAHLMPLKAQLKRPTQTGWPFAPAYTVDQIAEHMHRGGNVGVNLSLSRMICLDAENTHATIAVQNAGLRVTVIPAKAQMNQPHNKKWGGSHTWLRVPDGMDAATLPADAMGISLPGGGLIDALAGTRYAVAPGSKLAEAPQYSYAAAQGGPLDHSAYGADPALNLDVAPAWLFDRSVPVPAGLEPLHGCLAPRPQTVYDRVTADARSIELTDAVDAVSWETWIAGDHRITLVGQVDGCGCDIAHWAGSDNEKSMTLHDRCEVGNGAHVWSATMIAQLGLPGDHVSRLELAAKLRGCSVVEAGRAHGISIGGSSESLAPVLPEHYEQQAADAERSGAHTRAKLLRQAAEGLREALARDGVVRENSDEMYTSSPIAGGAPTPPVIEVTRPPEAAVHAETAPSLTDGATALSPRPAPPPMPASVPQPKPRKVRRFPEISDVADMPIPGDDEIYEYPFPRTPEHVPAVHSTRTQWAEMLPPIANRKTHETIEHEWIFTATPGLSQVAAAADARGVGRWGMLGALLPRVAANVPPTVRLIPADGSIPAETGPTGAGTSINLYSVLVGPPASGKSVTLTASDTLVPGVMMVPVGTGEGILKLFPRAGGESVEAAEDRSADGEAPHIGSVGEERACDSVLLSSDEIDVFVAEMGRQGTKATGLYRQMWMGGDVGNITSDRERHSMVTAHTYRFGIRLGAQPEAVSPLFSESDRGTPQRFLWLGAQRMPMRGGYYPERLQIAPVYWYGGAPSMLPQTGGPRPPVWVKPPPAAKEFMDDELWRSATANPMSPSGGYVAAEAVADRASAIADRHALLQQLKVCVVLAVLDGLAQPQDVHWYAAEAVMEVRRRVIKELVAVADAVRDEQARKRGKEQGIMRRHADAAYETESRTRGAEANAAVMNAAFALTRQRIPLTIDALAAEMEHTPLGNPDFVGEAVRSMVSAGQMAPTDDGRTYVLTLRTEPGDNTVTPLRPAPPISSIG